MSTKVIRVVAGYLGISFMSGAALGHMRNPNWDDGRAGDLFLHKFAKPVFLDTTAVLLNAACGTRVHTYDSRDRTLASTIVNDSMMDAQTYPTRGKYENTKGLGTLLFGSTPFVALAFTDDPVGTSMWLVILGGVAVGAAGGIAGYAVVHDETPDCGTSSMRAALADTLLWRTLAERRHAEFRAVYRSTYYAPLSDFCWARPRWYRPEWGARRARYAELRDLLGRDDARQLTSECRAKSDPNRLIRDYVRVPNQLMWERRAG